MPLPDERPRQSVANLIGRFEQQNKRQSLSSAGRSTSVASNSTGDPPKEEPTIKEKREWPPKPAGQNERPLIAAPPSSWAKATPTTQQAPPPNEPVEVTPPPVYSAIDAESSPTLALDSAPQAPDALSRKSSSESSTKPVSLPSQSPTPRSKVSAATRAINVSRAKTPVASTAKSPPKTSLGTSTSQPIKPQHTGQSTTSTSATRKPTSRTVPSTPSRKAPSGHNFTPRVGTPTRSKTPSSTRPKTPSSGLFAPTAASLARSRNAAPQLPTPVKKVTLSSSSAERLSKPTAASMSKARSPAPGVASPAKAGTKPPVAHSGAARSIVKPRVGLAPARMQQEKEKAAAKNKSFVPDKSTAVIVESLDAEDIPDEEDFIESGHELDTSQSIGDASIAGSDLHDEGSVIEYEEDILEGTEELADKSPEGNDHEADIHVEAEKVFIPYESPRELSPPLPETEGHDPNTDGTVEPEPTIDIESNAFLHAPDTEESKPELEHESQERLDEVKARSHVGNDIEDIVSFLESASDARPKSFDSIPDEDDVVEIPDEE